MTIARFWRESPARYNLIGSECGNCGKFFFPRRTVCPDCHRLSVGKMKPRKIKGDGEILSFSVIHDGARGFEMQTPYVLAIAEFEKSVRLTSQIIDCKPEDVKIGKKVQTEFRKLGEEGKSGVIHYGYKFRLVK